jgi:hypothetical protein
MAGRQQNQNPERISTDMDFETDDPRRAVGPNFGLQMMMDLTRAQAVLSSNVTALTAQIEKQGEKHDKISELRLEIRECATRIQILSDDHKETKSKLDKVRIWVAGAAAVVIVAVIAIQVYVRLTPPSPVVATSSTTQAPRNSP